MLAFVFDWTREIEKAPGAGRRDWDFGRIVVIAYSEEEALKIAEDREVGAEIDLIEEYEIKIPGIIYEADCEC